MQLYKVDLVYFIWLSVAVGIWSVFTKEDTAYKQSQGRGQWLSLQQASDQISWSRPERDPGLSQDNHWCSKQILWVGQTNGLTQDTPGLRTEDPRYTVQSWLGQK